MRKFNPLSDVLHPVFPVILLFFHFILSCANISPGTGRDVNRDERIQRPKIWVDAIQRDKAIIEEAIDSYLGVPYRFGGLSRRGIDCSGLVMNIYKQAGIRLPRSTHEQIGEGRKVGFSKLRFGDLLFFQIGSWWKWNKGLHAGIFLGDGRFVHASKNRGVIIDSFDKGYWRESLLEGRRVLQE